MMKMRLEFLVATIACMGVTSVRSNGTVNPDQSEIHGGIYNLFDSIGKSDVEKTNVYRNILEQVAVREQEAFDTMKDELRFARQRSADKPRGHRLKSHEIRQNAAKIYKRRESENSEERGFIFCLDQPFTKSHDGNSHNSAEHSLSVLELVAMDDLKRLKPHIDRYSKNKQERIPVDKILRLAAGLGHLDIIQYIVQEKPSILETGCTVLLGNCTLERGMDILIEAVQRGRLNVVRFIVEENPSLLDTRYGGYGRNMANFAAANGHQDILLYMLDRKPDSLVEQDESGADALISAARRNILTTNILKVLEAKGLFVRTAVTEEGKSICYIAAYRDNLDVVKYFVEEEPSYLSTTNGDFQWNITLSALITDSWVCAAGGQNVFRYMVEKDPSVLMKKDEAGTYLLLLAVGMNIVNSRELDSFVQKYGIPLGETNDRGETMAHMAARCNNLDIIAYIEEKDPTVLNKQSNDAYYSATVAGVAAMKSNWDIVKYLAKKNSSVYTEITYDTSGTNLDQRRESIFYLCVRKNLLDWETIKWLLEKEKVPLNLREIVDKRNLAQWALENKNKFNFEYIVAHELSLLYQRVNGSATGPTVAHLAVREGLLYATFISAAVEKIPSIFAQRDDSNNNNSVLHVAIEQGHIDIEMLERLLNGKYVSLSETNEKGDTLAHAAAAAPDDANIQMYYSKISERISKIVLPGDTGPSTRTKDADADRSHIIMYIATKQATLLAQKNNNGENVVHIAAKKGHVNALRVIIKVCSLSTLQATDQRENSALHLLAKAAKPIKRSTLDSLVEKGVPIMGVNLEGETAAHIAARNGLLRTVEYMVRKEPTVVKRKNSVGQTIVFTAASNAHCRIIRLVGDEDSLLERDYNGNTIFHLIMGSHSRNENDFQDTFRSIDIPVDLLVKPNNYGVSAVHLAAQVGCAWIIERVAAKNPRILLESDRNGDSAFSHAVRHQRASIVQIILAKNPKLETQQIRVLFRFPNEKELLNIVLHMEKNTGWNGTYFDGIAIHSAIESGYWSILNHFMEAGKVNVNQPDSTGEPPIFTAARCKHFDMLRYLVEQRGADLLKTDDRGNNILFVATENDDLSTIKYVLDERKAPIDVNSRNKVGDSILHGAMRAAVSRGKDWSKLEDQKIVDNADQDVTKIARYLIEEKRVDVNLPDHQNRTVFAYAVEHGRYDICIYLRNHGANDPRVKNGMGEKI